MNYQSIKKIKKSMKKISFLIAMLAIMVCAEAQMYVLSNGNVGIGKSPASGRMLDVLGHVYGNGFLLTSDERLKAEITPITDEKNRLYLLQGKFYKKAELCVYNMQGIQVKCLLVSERGDVNVQIQTGQLAIGVYTYFLIGDGKTSDAKQMILTM
jgi:hypothetical protein